MTGTVVAGALLAAASAGPGEFVRGPPLSPAGELLAWLDQLASQRTPRLVRLPVVLARGAVGFSTSGARLGGAAEAPSLRVDDGKLGIGLADRARAACKDAPTCALWLEGHWRGRHDGAWTFEVLRVGAPLDAAALAAATHVEVEPERKE